MADKSGFDTLVAACRAAARSCDRRARDADLSVGGVRVSRHRFCGRVCSTSNAPGTCTRGCRIRPMRCSRNASPRSKAASARSRRRAARRRCTWRLSTLCSAGDHIVASRSIYGGTHNLLAYTLPRFGITTTFVNPRDPAAFAAAIRPNTRLVFGETLGNPGLEVLNVPAVARVAHDAGLPLLIDSTFTTPYLMRPLDLRRRPDSAFGDEVPVRATASSSAACSSTAARSIGKRPADSRRSPNRTRVSTIWSSPKSSVRRHSSRARARKGLRDFGACMAPTTAFHILQGLETLSLRMDRHVANAHRIAEFLAATRPCRASAIRISHRIPITRSRKNCCRAAPARCCRSTSRAAATRDACSSRACDLLAPRERRRREVAGHSSGEHHAPPHGRGCVARGRHRRRARAFVGGSRRCRRSDRRPRPRARARAARGGLKHALKCAESTDVRSSSAPAAAMPRPMRAPVVFIHGAAHDHTIWVMPARYFARHGMRVIAPDLPGHGRTAGPALTTRRRTRGLDGPGARSVRRRERDDRRSQHGRARRDVASPSVIPRACARSRCSAFRCRWRSPRSYWAPRATTKPRRTTWRTAGVTARAARLGGNPNPGFWILGGGAALIARSDPGVHHADLTACNAFHCDVAAIRVPTLVIVGEADQMTPARSGAKLRRRCRTRASCRCPDAATRCCSSSRIRCSMR